MYVVLSITVATQGYVPHCLHCLVYFIYSVIYEIYWGYRLNREVYCVLQLVIESPVRSSYLMPKGPNQDPNRLDL